MGCNSTATACRKLGSYDSLYCKKWLYTLLWSCTSSNLWELERKEFTFLFPGSFAIFQAAQVSISSGIFYLRFQLNNLSLAEPEFLELPLHVLGTEIVQNKLFHGKHLGHCIKHSPRVKHHELPGKINATPKLPGFHRNWITPAASAEQNPSGGAAGVNSEVWESTQIYPSSS